VKLALILAAWPLLAQSPIGIYGTGLDAAGKPLADGAVDPHYRLVSSPDAAFPGPGAVVVNSNSWPIPPWLANGPASKWIAPQADQSEGNAAGVYTYRTTFDLTGFNAATAVLTGRWAADNSAVMKLNGVEVSFVEDFAYWVKFEIPLGFKAGINTLDFEVTNDGLPTGLRVDIGGTVQRDQYLLYITVGAAAIPVLQWDPNSIEMDTTTDPPTIRVRR
jgi:hypothetical protein